VPNLGPDPAVDIETRVPPGEEPFGSFRAQQLLDNQKPKNLPDENLSQPGVIDPRDFVESARPVHTALSHQEMKVGVDIWAFRPRLNGLQKSAGGSWSY
jgi:hypothetical protein